MGFDFHFQSTNGFAKMHLNPEENEVLCKKLIDAFRAKKQVKVTFEVED